MSQRIFTIFGGAAVVAVTVALVIALSGGRSSSTTAAATPAAAAQSAGAASGQVPQGGPPGMGTPVTGEAAAKVKAAALAEHPGAIERIMRLPDGSYEAHVIASSGEVHVLVSKAYKVIGVQQGGPGGPNGAGPGAGAPPAGAPPAGGSAGAGSASAGGVDSWRSAAGVIARR